MMDVPASHRVAGDTCTAALGGVLVSYPSGSKQRMVEVRHKQCCRGLACLPVCS